MRSASVQFKTGSDWQEHYVLGQRVSEREGLKTGLPYPGVVPRFCGDCSDEYCVDEVVATHAAFAELVEQRRLGIRPRGGAVDMTPDELRRRGESKAAEMRANRGRPGRSHEGLTGFDLRWDGCPVGRQDFDRYLAVVAELNRLVEERMKRSGWPLGRDWLREDLEVFLDPSRHIRLQDPS
jgi:hypothetical protein